MEVVEIAFIAESLPDPTGESQPTVTTPERPLADGLP